MRRRLLAVLALLGIGLVALLVSFMPVALPVAPLPAFADPPVESPAGMKIGVLRSGTMTSRAAFAYRGGAFSDERTFSMGAFVVKHPKGIVLVDTGFGSRVDEHVKASPLLLRATARYTKGVPVAAQLAALGVEHSQLAGILLTHAHWDHVSGVDDLRDVPVLLPQVELDFIRSGDRMTSLARSLGDVRYQPYDFPDGSFLGFEKSHDVFGDRSVVAVPAGGHTPGSVIVFVTLPDGARYALVGDLVWQREGVEIPAERPWIARRAVDKDEARVRVVVARLHALAARYPKLVIVPAHDARVWDALPAFTP